MSTLHPTIAQALAPFAPPLSVLHITPEQALRIDAAMHADKRVDGYGQRGDAQAMALQLKYQGDHQ